MNAQVKFVSESGHWYAPDGTPAYEVPYADPKKGMRPTTLRDAKKIGLYPSVTGIIRVAAAPALNFWKEGKLLEAAAETPREEGETLESWMSRVRAFAAEKQAAAPDLGTRIHAAIERLLGDLPVDDDLYAFAAPVVNWVDKTFPGWTRFSERSFAHPRGYGGKVDLALEHDKLTVVIDFKTTDKPIESVKGYDNHIMQLAACAEGLGYDCMDTRCINLFISSTTPGEIKAIEWDYHQAFRGWNQFNHLLDYWMLANNYEVVP